MVMLSYCQCYCYCFAAVSCEQGIADMILERESERAGSRDGNRQLDYIRFNYLLLLRFVTSSNLERSTDRISLL